MEVKIGDVVRLPSGGPAMTVMGTAHDLPGDAVSAAWFTQDGELREGTFLVATLIIESVPTKYWNPSRSHEEGA